jgi:hypothetical protein
MTFAFDHPSSGLPHPWNDPLGAVPLGADRPPDWMIPGAPDRHDFPFNDQGQRDYFAAVSNAALQRQAMLMGARARQVAQVNAASGNGRSDSSRVGFLLLLS